MSLGGQPTPGGNFIATVAKHVVSYIGGRRLSTDPSDGLVLQLHYKWTFGLFILLYTIVMGSWYNKDLMDCANKFNGAVPIPWDYLTFCHSYIFVQDDDDGGGGDGGGAGERRYLFFYKWLHYVNLLLAFWYYMPRKLNKAFHRPILSRLCAVLHQERPLYDVKAERAALGRLSAYINEHLRTHNSLYFAALVTNTFALFVNLVGISLIDFVLQGRFLAYGWKSVPFHRDMEHFTDYMSRTFPPFALCTIGLQHELTPGRVESFGCRLVLMELYEKLFFVLWVWLMFLAALTVLYIVFLLLLFHPRLRRWALKAERPEIAASHFSSHDLLEDVLHNCKIGDVWLLYKLKKNVSSTRYYMLLCQLSQPGLREVVSGESAQKFAEVDCFQPQVGFLARPSPAPEQGLAQHMLNMHLYQQQQQQLAMAHRRT